MKILNIREKFPLVKSLLSSKLSFNEENTNSE